MDTPRTKENQPGNNGEDNNYLFFSSLELIDYFVNNLADKDIKTQTKRIFEMARVFMRKKDFKLEDIYSVLIMVRNIELGSQIDEVFSLYFKEGNYPIRVFIRIADLESTADVELEFSAYRGSKKYINNEKLYLFKEPFSHGVIIENYLHCSGIQPFSPLDQRLIDDNFEQAVRQCLENLKNILESAGSSLNQIYSFMVYLKDLNTLPEVEEIVGQYISNQSEILQDAIKIEQFKGNHNIEIACSAYLC
ncbi:RidA family protein [Dehalobacter sp. TBBPA1]|uniref:RidA family protein n=1 Tax=Dehalobacter sp. TBBPA1 TaxID=3235037 RepID=UPI0034A1A1AE